MLSRLKSYWPLILIFTVSFFFRFYHLSAMTEFLGDQGRDVLIVRDILKHANLVFIGPQTSIGNMYLGPFYYYLMAPFLLLFNYSPLGPVVMVGIGGVVTTLFLYFICRRFFSLTISLLVALLYAVSPIVIRYSTFSWNPNIMPLFALLAFWSLVQIWQSKNYRWLPILSLSLAIALQSHFLALLLIPFSGLFLVWSFFLVDKSAKSQFVRYTFLALLIFLAFLLPQLLFDLKHHGQNISAIKTFFTIRQTTVNLKAYKAIPNIWPLFSQIVTRLLAATNQTLGIVVSVFLSLSSIFIFASGLKHYRQINLFFNRYSLLIILFVWFAIALVGLGLYKQHIYDHYFGFLFPAPFLLLGLVLDSLPVKALGKLILVLLIGYSVQISWQAFRYPRNQLRDTRQIAEFILTKAGGQPFNFALLAKTNYDDAYQYFLDTSANLFFDPHSQITNQLFVVCEPHPDITCQPEGNPQWEIAAFGWAKVIAEWEIAGRRIYQLVHY